MLDEADIKELIPTLGLRKKFMFRLKNMKKELVSNIFLKNMYLPVSLFYDF